jgi:HK97 gp10 family phage protein
MSNITLKVEGLDKLQAGMTNAPSVIRKEVKWAMTNSVNAVKITAADNAPFKTGTLKRSIHTDIQDEGFKGVVYQNPDEAPYGIFIEYGTKPHEINPTNKKALFWNGAINPYKRVMHPGSKANPFMTPALENNVNTIQAYFEKAIQNLFNTL